MANLYMEKFEVKALSTSPTPRVWKRYVDDTFKVIKTIHKSEFLEHNNFIDQCIQFTQVTRVTRVNGSMSFLDTVVIPQPDGRLETTVYRKSTHTDQYLPWDSHHTTSAKHSAVSTQLHRARAVCSNPQQIREEHIQEAISNCKYPMWALNRMKMKSRAQATPVNITCTNKSSSNTSYNQRLHMAVLFIKGLDDSFRNVCNKHRILYFRGCNTIKSLLMASKDRHPITKKSRVI